MKAITKKKELPNEKEILLKAWKARRFLRIHDFLPDSENAKIQKRLVAYQSKHNIEISAKELN